jgi:hypothetical protein
MLSGEHLLQPQAARLTRCRRVTPRHVLYLGLRLILFTCPFTGTRRVLPFLFMTLELERVWEIIFFIADSMVLATTPAYFAYRG